MTDIVIYCSEYADAGQSKDVPESTLGERHSERGKDSSYNAESEAGEPA